MCNRLVNMKYKNLIIFLKNNNFSYKKEKNNLLYIKNDLIIKLNSTNIDISVLSESRCYCFTSETSSQLLINFIDYFNKIIEKA